MIIDDKNVKRENTCNYIMINRHLTKKATNRKF
jgi:hypothetical protein